MNSLHTVTGGGDISLTLPKNKPGYRQWNPYSCGYFCAKAMINVLGNGNIKNLTKSLKLSTDGTRQVDLVYSLRQRGVSASVYYNLTQAKRLHFLNAGKYIISYDNPLEHWLVLGKIFRDKMFFYDPENKLHSMYSEYMLPRIGSFGIVCGRK